MLKKKNIAICIFLPMVIFLNSCFFNASINDTKITASSSEVDTEKEKQLFIEIDREYKDSLKEGLKEYHIDNEEPFDIFLPLDFEEYCTQLTDGATSFDLEKLLEDYGWREGSEFSGYRRGLNRDPKDGRIYWYEYGDLTIELQILYDIEDEAETMHVCGFVYTFLQTQDMEKHYYIFNEVNYAPTDDSLFEFEGPYYYDYLIDEEKDVYTSKGICLLLACAISWVDVKPEAAPFLYQDIPYYDFGPEYRKSLQRDFYLFWDVK